MTGQPKDHLGPGGARRGEEPGTETPAGREDGREDVDAGPTTGGGNTAVPAEPLDVPGAPDAAARGKATRSPAEVATRPHLEGSEQGPM
ncbi:MAG TPA: hypothetical protein VFP56_08985 [Candidatus Limnocylindrales bacterium]|nr:hypothetical protein [Candidatus Limnocylindrales bacterium]